MNIEISDLCSKVRKSSDSLTDFLNGLRQLRYARVFTKMARLYCEISFGL